MHRSIIKRHTTQLKCIWLKALLFVKLRLRCLRWLQVASKSEIVGAALIHRFLVVNGEAGFEKGFLALRQRVVFLTFEIVNCLVQLLSLKLVSTLHGPIRLAGRLLRFDVARHDIVFIDHLIEVDLRTLGRLLIELLVRVEFNECHVSHPLRKRGVTLTTLLLLTLHLIATLNARIALNLHIVCYEKSLVILLDGVVVIPLTIWRLLQFLLQNDLVITLYYSLLCQHRRIMRRQFIILGHQFPRDHGHPVVIGMS